jgi:hypothetical protein
MSDTDTAGDGTGAPCTATPGHPCFSRSANRIETADSSAATGPKTPEGHSVDCEAVHGDGAHSPALEWLPDVHAGEPESDVEVARIHSRNLATGEPVEILVTGPSAPPRRERTT